MSNAREAILNKLREGRQDLTPPPQGDYRRVERSKDERVERFCQMMQSVKGEIHHVTSSNWVEKLKLLSLDKGIKNLLHGPNTEISEALQTGWRSGEGLPELICPKESVDDWREALFFNTDAAITTTRCGIADTGSLVLWPTPQEPRTYSLVPTIHFALLDADKLHNTFADLIEAEQWYKGLPTNALLISGPSKSADIEQNLVYGVHGPMQLIILLIDEK
jgi:L-lactate dehydrogenase complex protein LldG